METDAQAQEPIAARRRQGDEDDATASSGARKRQKLEFERFANSATLSDITIRYGVSGELTFQAHRLLLSSKSYWFNAAFTGGFSESNAKEIVLKDDDPVMIKAMLDFAYGHTLSELKTADSIHAVLFCIGLFRVADKYDYPDLEEVAREDYGLNMNPWSLIDNDPKTLANDLAYQKIFCQIVAETYKLPNAGLRHPLVKELFVSLEWLESTGIIGNAGIYQARLLYAANEITEFGRDLFLHFTTKTGTEKHPTTGGSYVKKLDVTTLVKCPECSRHSKMCIEYTLDPDNGGHCMMCGDFVEDWTAYIECW